MHNDNDFTPEDMIDTLVCPTFEVYDEDVWEDEVESVYVGLFYKGDQRGQYVNADGNQLNGFKGIVQKPFVAENDHDLPNQILVRGDRVLVLMYEMDGVVYAVMKDNSLEQKSKLSKVVDYARSMFR